MIPPDQFGRVPPAAPELEQAVLGACMIAHEALAEVADFLRPEMFYVIANERVWQAIATLYGRRDPVDILTVTTELKRRDLLDAVGGAFYIASLTAKVASGANVQYHARQIQQHYIGREAIRIGSELTKAGYDASADPFDTLAGAANEIRILNEYGGSDERTMAEIMPDVVDNIGPDRGVRFGYDALDSKIRSEPGTVTIIGARPAMGKTAFMLSAAWRQAQRGHKVYIAEMEMRDRNLATRLSCGENGVPVWKAKRKAMDEQDLTNMSRWHIDKAEALGRMHVNESAAMTVSSLAARLDRAKRKKGIDVVWIDYIGLLQPSTKQKPGYDRMTAISNELRVLAKEMDLAFNVLAQLSRPVKGAAVKPPVLTDLRDSGEIEQDAEAVIFLHRPKYYDHAADDVLQVIVAKNRDGEDGLVDLWFDGPGVRVLDYPQPMGDVPRFDVRAGMPSSVGVQAKMDDPYIAPF